MSFAVKISRWTNSFSTALDSDSYCSLALCWHYEYSLKDEYFISNKILIKLWIWLL